MHMTDFPAVNAKRDAGQVFAMMRSAQHFPDVNFVVV
jgi:hypothetical protein